MKMADAPPLARILWRAHKILNRMRIRPLVDMRIDPLDEHHHTTFFDRLATVQLYMDGIRGKWLREKKKAVAANRALEDYRSGNTKTWKAKAEARQQEIDRALDVFAKQHKVITHYAGFGSKIVDLMTYLVDRSNQLYANDSTLEKQLREELKTAKLDAQMQRTRAELAERNVKMYMSTYGPRILDTDVGRDTSELTAHADSFPWKRGNPGYLADYTVEELLHEVEMRYAGLDMANKARRAVDGR